MGLQHDSDFFELLNEAIESHLLKEHLSLYLKKSTSPLSQDYLKREHIAEVATPPKIKPTWERRTLPQTVLTKIESLERELSFAFPDFFSLDEAGKYLSNCLKHAHPDTNPEIAPHIFQKIFPICQELKKYFRTLKDRKKPHPRPFTAPYQK